MTSSRSSRRLLCSVSVWWNRVSPYSSVFVYGHVCPNVFDTSESYLYAYPHYIRTTQKTVFRTYLYIYIYKRPYIYTYIFWTNIICLKCFFVRPILHSITILKIGISNVRTNYLCSVITRTVHLRHFNVYVTASLYENVFGQNLICIIYKSYAKSSFE